MQGATVQPVQPVLPDLLVQPEQLVLRDPQDLSDLQGHLVPR
jgi:hypothetical protein